MVDLWVKIGSKWQFCNLKGPIFQKPAHRFWDFDFKWWPWWNTIFATMCKKCWTPNFELAWFVGQNRAKMMFSLLWCLVSQNPTQRFGNFLLIRWNATFSIYFKDQNQAVAKLKRVESWLGCKSLNFIVQTSCPWICSHI